MNDSWTIHIQWHGTKPLHRFLFYLYQRREPLNRLFLLYICRSTYNIRLTILRPLSSTNSGIFTPRVDSEPPYVHSIWFYLLVSSPKFSFVLNRCTWSLPYHKVSLLSRTPQNLCCLFYGANLLTFYNLHFLCLMSPSNHPCHCSLLWLVYLLRF